MHVFKNTTGGIKGVTLASGEIVNVDPGQSSRPLEVTDADMKVAEATGWFSIRKAVKEDDKEPEMNKGPEDGSIQNDTATIEGNPVKPATAFDIARANAEREGEEDDFAKMDDDALRAYLTDRDGKAPHHKAGRPKLLAMAREGDGDDEGDDEGAGV